MHDAFLASGTLKPERFENYSRALNFDIKYIFKKNMSVPKQNYWAGDTIIILYIIISVTIILSIVLQIVVLYIYLTTQVNVIPRKR